ncbi:succinate dehydrogenase cytochrome b subunit [Desertihabitans aurantiacus]|uniref:succinate dehydrogenase cytochrome b subunit n=1 Tax=Desertihabitans aurantiacus TaxID=2282477 RepID=UPI000DF75FAD|nr:succinate dehydrogenase cytochrome b subunit [Desertihabitans aurantiacus]
MATTTISAQRRALRSTVAKKVIMAVSGLIMVGYLLAHMYGNLKAFSGMQAFDEYSHHLRELGEPILPPSGALWIIRVVLLVAVVAHIWAAVLLARRSWTSAGVNRYETRRNRRGIQRTYASFTLRSGGLVIALFVVYHLAHLTWHWIEPGGSSPSPYGRLVAGFSVWWVVALYVIALLAVGFHLRHGVASALYTLGAGTTATARQVIVVLSIVTALVITVGFLLVPFSVLLGVIQ